VAYWKAINRAKKEVELSPENIYIRGEIYLEKGDKESTKREFELALKYNKNFQPAKEALSQL
jgi:predicted negative regulator of RcsB-dependent stress response